MTVINDNTIEKWWQEPGINNEGTDDDPYVESTPENMIRYLENRSNFAEVQGQMKVPYTNFKTFVNGEWKEVDTEEIFSDKKIIICFQQHYMPMQISGKVDKKTLEISHYLAKFL